ncbi:hypothetical protein ACFPTY_01550 [Halomonas beimenensis]|uniref:Uncharacterized protein n=1 Tax=Halomonas beimenensis TaxID=475662 RepID=A0A291P416_9GAMM|nr:hypothetical protein [Halomonas beimenensis]ATJ81643.1 hypothetical protein BEI_0656 [Halomonas beimenensis]
MKRLTTVTLSTLLLLSGPAVADHHGEEMAAQSGVDTANAPSEDVMSDDAKLQDEPIVEDGGIESAADPEGDGEPAPPPEGELAPQSGVDSAQPEED